jgi:ABC-type nitrate/sulfonate/bicarbonate transport system substrate-binding protein
MKAMIAAGGGDPASLDIPNVGYGGAQVAALQSGQVDAVLAHDSTKVAADKIGLGASVFSLLEDAPAQYQGMLSGAFVATGDTLAKHPDFADRFHRATAEAYAWMKDPANSAEMQSIAIKVEGLPDSPELPQRLATLAGQLTTDVDRATLERSMQFLYDTGQIAPEPRVTVDQFFNPVMITAS